MLVEASLITMELVRSAALRTHETGVGRLTATLCRKLGYEDSEAETLGMAATLHDIGKLAVPDSILQKPGKLDKGEWRIVRQHTRCGYEVLMASGTELGKLAAQVALLHHECWDGSGYPYGLAGEDIPHDAHIVSLCDCYDAMREVRPYKQPRTHEEVMSIILGNHDRGAVAKFDPALLTVVSANSVTLRDTYKNPS